MGAARASPSAFPPISRTRRHRSENATRPWAKSGLCVMQDSVANPPPLRVLIVDADRDCAETFAEHLMAHGIEVAVAVPGEMFDALRDFDASIVLCDIEGEGAAGSNLPGQLLEGRPDLLCIA